MKLSEKVEAEIKTAMLQAFPSCPVEFYCDPDDENVVYVRAYCIPDDEVYAAKQRAWKVLAPFDQNSEVELVPSIVSIANTKRSHPQFLSVDSDSDFDLPVPMYVFKKFEDKELHYPSHHAAISDVPCFSEWGRLVCKMPIDSIREVECERGAKIAA